MIKARLELDVDSTDTGRSDYWWKDCEIVAVPPERGSWSFDSGWAAGRVRTVFYSEDKVYIRLNPFKVPDANEGFAALLRSNGWKCSDDPEAP